MGDTVHQKWSNLSSVRKKGLTALAFHDHSNIVGRWFNPVVEKDGEKEFTIADLELLPRDTSDVLRTLWALAERSWLATSIGFTPLKYEPLDEDDIWGGWDITESELLETSVVAVGANPDALPVEGKSLKRIGIVRELPNTSFASVFDPKSDGSTISTPSGDETIELAKRALSSAQIVLRIRP
jgi:HK97 family phage prohead protease